MRCYYLFKINEDFSKLYKNKTYYLYKTLEDISKMNKNDFLISYKLYSQIVDGYDKKEIGSNIYRLLCFDKNYYKTLNKHIYDDGVEKTKLIICNSYIKIISNKNVTMFFKSLKKQSNILVCDFQNKDYFWLSNCFRKTLAQNNYF